VRPEWHRRQNSPPVYSHSRGPCTDKARGNLCDNQPLTEDALTGQFYKESVECMNTTMITATTEGAPENALRTPFVQLHCIIDRCAAADENT
jgi:hypothetical protein